MSLESWRVSALAAVRTLPAGVLGSWVCGIPPVQDHLDVLSILQNREKLIIQAGPTLTHNQHRLPVLGEPFGTVCADRPRDFRIIQGFFHPNISPAPRANVSQGFLL